MYKQVMQNRRDAERYRKLKSLLLSGVGLEVGEVLIACAISRTSSKPTSDEIDAVLDQHIHMNKRGTS